MDVIKKVSMSDTLFEKIKAESHALREARRLVMDGKQIHELSVRKMQAVIEIDEALRRLHEKY